MFELIVLVAVLTLIIMVTIAIVSKPDNYEYHYYITYKLFSVEGTPIGEGSLEYKTDSIINTWAKLVLLRSKIKLMYLDDIVNLPAGYDVLITNYKLLEKVKV